MSSLSSETKDLFAALVKAQSKIRGALKDSDNPFFKSKYADLESCWEAIRDPLTANGLCIIQTMAHENGEDYLDTTLAHTSGQWIKGRIRLLLPKKDPQGMGSSITYARRYGLAAIVGLTQVDDDAEAAVGRIVNNGGGRIVPLQPGPEDGVRSMEYTIPFGKFKSYTLEQVGPDKLRSYVNYIEDKARKDGKQVTGDVANFIDRASEYVASFENSSIEQETY